MIHVMVVEDNALVRDYIVRAISDQPGFKVVATSESASDAMFHCQRLKIDIILMDIHSRFGRDGLSVAREIKEKCQGVAIVMMTGMPTVGLVEEAKEIGVESFIAKDMPIAQVVEVLKSSLKGKNTYPY